MKVLFQNRADAFSRWGGDTTQMVKTREELQKLGVKVDVSLEMEPDLEGYDLVHIFNIQTARQGYRQLAHAKGKSLPVALSTIYWDFRHVENDWDVVRYHELVPVRFCTQIGLLCLAKTILFCVRNSPQAKFKFALSRKMLMEADILLPNSYAEAEILALLFSAPLVRAKVHVVPNGVVVSEILGGPEAERDISGLPKEYVLEAGRIEPIKGQLKVIKALMGHPEIPLVFIGKSDNLAYLEACRKAAVKRGNTWFIDGVTHEEMPHYYARARVHVLPSLRESPGLATLEAAILGANCVVSIHAPVAEYFGSDVWCCDPSDPSSIDTAILEAWQAPRRPDLGARVREKFTWSVAARETLKAYQNMLGREKPS